MNITTLAICNMILPKEDQENIEAAAQFEHEGLFFAAEACRHRAGYGVPESPKRPPHGGYPDA